VEPEVVVGDTEVEQVDDRHLERTDMTVPLEPVAAQIAVAALKIEVQIGLRS